KLLADDSRTVRTRAALALWRVGGDAKPALAALTANLRGATPVVRREALNTLTEMGAPAASAAPAVLELLDDPDPALRSQASSTLVRFGRPGVDALLKGLRAKEARLRRNAAGVLTSYYGMLNKSD